MGTRSGRTLGKGRYDPRWRLTSSADLTVCPRRITQRSGVAGPKVFTLALKRGREGMQLQGSCHCGAVRFSVAAYAPVPYLRCYCSICRKTAGGGGFAINLGAKADTLRIEGEESITVFHAKIDGAESPAERRFCSRCGSALWVWDPRWPELVHPFASAIDTPLPEPPECEHIMIGSKANWVRVDAPRGERCYDEYPPNSVEDWHRTHGILDQA
jgi:hypothetical protein